MDQAYLVFVTVVEKASFTRAAETLHMTQPAVSQYIRALEKELGTRLLERNNKQVVLNKAGEIVYHHMKEIIALHARMRGLVDELMNVTGGELAIGASFTYGEYILPYILAELKRLFPLIHPRITIGNTQTIEELILQRSLDLGVVEGDKGHDKLIMEPIWDDEMVVVASADYPYDSGQSLSISDLQHETWVIREQGSGTREASDKLFQMYQFQPANRLELGSTQIIKESVEAGLGVSLLSKWAIQKELKLNTLQMLNVRQLPLRRKFSLVTLKDPFMTHAMKAVINLLRTGMGQPRF